MTLFKELAGLCKSLEGTTKRKEKTALIAEFLGRLDESEIKPAILLIIGSVLPETDDRSLDVGWKTVRKVMDRKGQTTLFRRDLNIEDRFGYTALGLAKDKGYKEIVDLLTAAGAR